MFGGIEFRVEGLGVFLAKGDGRVHGGGMSFRTSG